MTQCPNQCESRHVLVKSIKGYKIYECITCEHRFMKIENKNRHVHNNYGDDYFFDGEKGGYPNYHEGSELLVNRGRKYAKILTENGIQPGKLLDVGAAAGYILKGFTEEGWQGIGIEPNKSMVRYARRKLKLSVHESALENFEFNEKFDCISLIQVIAHFYNLGKAIDKIHELLDENGILLIETWDRKSLTARLFGWKWHEYSPPTVVHWFSKDGLISLFEKEGFRLIKSGTLPKQIIARHAKNLLLQKLDNAFMRIILRILPDKLKIIYPSEDLFYVIFQKSPGSEKNPLD